MACTMCASAAVGLSGCGCDDNTSNSSKPGYKVEPTEPDLTNGDFGFFIINKEELMITKYTGSDTVIEIPESYKNYKVTVIGASVFNNSKITEVTIPSSIKQIEDYAFSSCHSLTKVNLSEGLLTIAKDELNIKEFEILHDASKFVSYKLKPQLKTLGPKYGKAIGAIRNFLDTCNAAEVVACVKAGKTYKVNLDGTDVEFALDDLLISSESAEGYVSESSDGLTVVLDVHISEELMLEGAVRELVSRIQNMRKEAGFEVTDRIVLGYKAEGVSGRVLKEMADEIKSDVLAEEITTTPDGYVKDFDINGESVTLGVKKV